MVQSPQPGPRRPAPPPAGFLPPLPATASWIAARSAAGGERARADSARDARVADRADRVQADPDRECRCPDACLRDHPNE